MALPANSPRSRRGWRLAGLVALTISAYAPLATSGFVYEDRSALIETTLGPSPAPLAWTRPRSLTRLSYRVDRWYGQGRPWAFHLSNLALHLANGGLVMATAHVLAPAAMLPAGVVFLLSPIQSEAVAYGAGRSELLATGLALLAVWLWVQVRSEWQLIPVAGLIAAAVLAKESAAPIVGVLVCATGCRFALRPSRRTVCEIAVAILGCAAFIWSVVRPEFQVAADVGRLRFAGLQAAALSRIAWSAVTMTGQTVDPYIEAWRPVWGWLSLWLWAAVAMAGVVAAIIYQSAGGWTPRRRLCLFGLAWAGIALSPRLVMRVPEVLNEHQTYLAMAGVALAIGSCWVRQETDCADR